MTVWPQTSSPPYIWASLSKLFSYLLSSFHSFCLIDTASFIQSHQAMRRSGQGSCKSELASHIWAQLCGYNNRVFFPWPTIAGGKEEMDWVQDVLTKPFSRWTFIGELDLMRECRPTLITESPVRAGGFSISETTNGSHWISPQRAQRIVSPGELFICSRSTVWHNNANLRRRRRNKTRSLWLITPR